MNQITLNSIGCVNASEDKDTTQERNTISKELSLDSVDSEREKTKDKINSNPSKQQNVNKKKDVREGDGSDNDEDSSNKDTSTTSSTNQQHTPNPGINKAKTRGGRWLHQDGTKTLTFHPKQSL